MKKMNKKEEHNMFIAMKKHYMLIAVVVVAIGGWFVANSNRSIFIAADADLQRKCGVVCERAGLSFAPMERTEGEACMCKCVQKNNTYTVAREANNLITNAADAHKECKQVCRRSVRIGGYDVNADEYVHRMNYGAESWTGKYDRGKNPEKQRGVCYCRGINYGA